MPASGRPASIHLAQGSVAGPAATRTPLSARILSAGRSVPDRSILAEPFGDHFVKGAILLHRFDHRIDGFLEIGIALAEADGDAFTDRDGLADDDDFAARFLDD